MNVIVERDQFRQLEQRKDKRASKVRIQGEDRGPDVQVPMYYMLSNRQADEIRTQILCKMKNKEIQRELWREDKAVSSLEDVLRIIRAGKATHQQQSALSNQAVAEVRPGIKCFECGKEGHLLSNCPTACKPNPSRSNQCSFCRGPRKCKAKFCKALNNRCRKCKLFGHFDQCCVRPELKDKGSIPVRARLELKDKGSIPDRVRLELKDKGSIPGRARP